VSTQDEVLDAAASVVAAFGSGDLDAYFASFTEDATFIFHGTDRVVTSRAGYRAEWAEWERAEGFRVLECTPSEQRVQDLGDVAVFTHRVRTRVWSVGAEAELHERETIVFQRDGHGHWVAVHEHLSPDPAASAG
jgi:ketosteroid isomerase-like protein